MIIESYIPYTEIKNTIIALLSLPDKIRPTSYSIGEDDKRVRFKDKEEYKSYIAKSKSGFLLWAKQICYDINFYSLDTYSHITVFDGGSAEKLTESDAEAILKTFARSGSLFSFAGSWDEYEHRNRYFSRQFGVSQLEAWIGRDLRKYLPGIYWLTVLTKEQKEISMDISSALGAKVEQIDGGHWLIKAYDNPNEWRVHAPRIDKWLGHQPGFFSKNQILPILDGASDLRSLRNAISKWR